MTFWQEVWAEIGVTGPQAVSLVIASVVLYFAFALFLQVFGQRVYADKSATGMALALVVGAIMARSMLGPGPTMTAGLIVLFTLLMCETVFDLINIAPRDPVVVWRDGAPLRRVLRRFHIHEETLRGALRKAQIRDLALVHEILLEPDGSFTVLRKDKPLDPKLLEGFRNHK